MLGFRSILIRFGQADAQSQQHTKSVTVTTVGPSLVQQQHATTVPAPAVTREDKTTTPVIVGPFPIEEITFGFANTATALKGAASDSSSTSTDSHGARSASSIEAERTRPAPSDAFAWSTDFPTDYFEARVKWDPRVLSDEFARIAFFLWRRRVLDDSAPFQDLGDFAREVEEKQCKPKEHPSYY